MKSKLPVAAWLLSMMVASFGRAETSPAEKIKLRDGNAKIVAEFTDQDVKRANGHARRSMPLADNLGWFTQSRSMET